MMKKKKIAMIMGAAVLALSACGQTGEPQKFQTNAADNTEEMSGGEEQSPEIPDDETPVSSDCDPAEVEDEGHSAILIDDVLESLTGEYDYSSGNGIGRLTIKKTSDGYDISDYESEDSYRFLADSSYIESMEANRIYMRYPEQIYSDGTAVFGYYILEYDTDGIDVYYGKSTFDEAAFLYHAVKRTEALDDADEYEDTYSDSADQETTAEELLDLFISGSVNAVDPEDLTSTFYIADLNMDSGEWDSYSIGEKVDLDNDGEDELVLNGPYGGIYLDARDDKVYVFAAGEGTALILSYTYYNGDIWILYSNRSSAGFEAYHMERFEGADHPVAEMNFGEELVDSDDPESETKYMLNGKAISYDEYSAFCSKIFAAEVSTES